MKPTPPTLLPPRVDSSVLAKHRHPGEPLIVLKLVGVGNTAPYDFRGKGTRSFIFRYDSVLDGHTLRVPLHLWQENSAHLAHEIMDQRHLTHAIVVTLEAAAPAQAHVAAASSPFAHGTGQTHAPAAGLLALAPDARTAAAATQAQTPTFSIAPETGATDTSTPARNVVGPGEEEPTVAPTSAEQPQNDSDSSGTRGDTTEEPLPLQEGRPLHLAAYDLLLQPKRLKALAALLGTSEPHLRRAIAQPASGLELATAGWVRRKATTPAA